ncbi:DUF4910 domain-containing protein [Thermococcus sp.]|uniref:DUF4910 domain-containing protein n=1 Tax=Thermococcus sp. TaxID=35749 RepID=UPI00261A6B48|nr:DUF4910 domain-containing protein [Thermococcus sp.]
MRRFLDSAKVLDSTRVLHYIGEISQFHRIQGSKDLVGAVRFIQEELSIWDLDPVLHKETYDGKTEYLTFKSPVAWDPVEGFVEVLGERLTTSLTPLVVMAHSQSGEAEGEVLHVTRESDWKDAGGKVVLVENDWRNAYRKANESGAIGFIAYRRDTGEHVPYIGLFLTEKDLEWAHLPAVAVPETLAERMIAKLSSGESVTARLGVDAELHERQTLPVLYAEVGKPPFILFTAHICHPKPGANDNASGSAMLMELARVLGNLHNDSDRFGFAFLWVPEYYGTAAFIERHADLRNYYAVTNLDMVAGSPDRSGSTIMLVRTPLSRFSVVSGVLEYYLALANGRGSDLAGNPTPAVPFRAYPYEMGSDHDLFNFFGVPSVMPITWPDRFYHSSGDTIDKVSLNVASIIGRAVLAASLALSRASSEELERFARGYTMKYLGELAMDTETEVAERLVMTGLARDASFLGFRLGHPFEAHPWVVWRKKGILTADFIRRRKESLAVDYERLTRERKVLTLLHELLMLGELLPKGESFKALSEEYGQVDEGRLERLITILEEAGVVSVLG